LRCTKSLSHISYQFRAPFAFRFKKEIWSQPLPVFRFDQYDILRIGIPTPDWKIVDSDDEKATEAVEHLLGRVEQMSPSSAVPLNEPKKLIWKP